MSKQMRRPARPAVSAITRAPKGSPTNAKHFVADKNGQLVPRENIAQSVLDPGRKRFSKPTRGYIADDDDDIVVSIRISKWWLRQNHPLLAALSDAARRNLTF